jgi:hypothetical protein
MVGTTDIDIEVTSSKYYGLYTLQKKETEHAEKYNLLPIFNIILNTEITITLH